MVTGNCDMKEVKFRAGCWEEDGEKTMRREGEGGGLQECF